MTAYVRTYQVTHLPPDSINASIWCVEVRWRGSDKWAVTWAGRCLDDQNDWVYEPSPSGRDDEFLSHTRFDLATALRLAETKADELIINGKSWRDVADHPHSQVDGS